MSSSFMVVDRVPIARAGLVTILRELGFAADGTGVDDTVWLDEERDGCAVVVREGATLQMLEKLAAHRPDLACVAVLVDDAPEAHAEALRLGATGTVGWDAEPGLLRRVMELALLGYSVLPAEVARTFATRASSLRLIDEEQIAWLRQLARGITIAELASVVGYTERSMYRLLGALYGRLGVSNRSEAVVEASRRGLLS